MGRCLGSSLDCVGPPGQSRPRQSRCRLADVPVRRDGPAAAGTLREVALTGAAELLADELTRNGPVELLVNNVGITTPHRFGEIGLDPDRRGRGHP
jgi:hypothetical protein